MEQPNKSSGCLIWVLATVLAPWLAIGVLMLVFGVTTVSSASAWGIGPLMPLLLALGLLPVLWLVLWLFGVAQEPSHPNTRLRGLLVALALYSAALAVVWGVLGGGRVMSVMG